MTAALALVKRFWYVIPLVGLLITVLVMRNDLTDKTAKLDAANVRVTDVTAANKGLSTALDKVNAARVDNDAIATAVAAKLGTNTVRETNTRTIIEKAAANDPAVRNLVDTPLPDSVRAGLRAN